MCHAGFGEFHAVFYDFPMRWSEMEKTQRNDRSDRNDGKLAKETNPQIKMLENGHHMKVFEADRTNKDCKGCLRHPNFRGIRQGFKLVA